MKALDYFAEAMSNHPDLFTDPVWEALRILPEYMDGIVFKGAQPITGVTLLNAESISIEAGCVIEPGCLIEGPCIIGSGSVLRHGSAVRGYTLIGKNCVVGHASEIKRSILFDGAKAPHFNYVGDSILGRGVNLGAGAKLANLRLDHQPVTVLYDGKTHDTGLRKFGAVLGDGCQIGCNCVVNPGTLLPPNFVVLPRSTSRGVAHERHPTSL